MGYICGIDTGGTFTDCVLVDEAGTLVTAKAPSTPDDVTRGFFESLRRAAGRLGKDLDTVLGEMTQLVHGTTVGTNVMVQRNGAKIGLLTTQGFGDTIFLMRGVGRVTGLPPEEVMHVSALDKPTPIVPREFVVEVTERVDVNGEVVVALDEDQVRSALRNLIDRGVRAIAVCFLWSLRNPAHEHRVREIAAELDPMLLVSCSADLAPKLGEYERTATAAIDAYIAPATVGYIRKLADTCAEHQFNGNLLVMQCHGGVTPVAHVDQAPILTVQSGPAAGLQGSRYVGELLGHRNIIASDMGGTSFDVALVVDGEPVKTPTAILSQYTYYAPTIDIQSIGAGGGSIAWLNETSGTMRVGPRSAGAVPGPACYGNGGTEPTVTDADVVLGYVSPEAFLAGDMRLDADAARRAMEPLAGKLGVTVEQVAAGLSEIVDLHMADMIRKVTINRGLDPREFVVYAYGGAGPVHAVRYSRELGVSTVIVPGGEVSSVWSALGCACSDLTSVVERGDVYPEPFAVDEIARSLAELADEAANRLRVMGVDDSDITVTRFADLRYRAQVHVLPVPFRDGPIDEAALQELVDTFEQRYEALYGAGAGFREAGVDIVALRCEASGRQRKPTWNSNGAPLDGSGGRPRTQRSVYSTLRGEFVDTDIWYGGDIHPGVSVPGPAVIELDDTSIVLDEGDRATVDELGNYVITLRSED